VNLIYNWDAVHIIKTIGSVSFRIRVWYPAPKPVQLKWGVPVWSETNGTQPSGWKASSGYGPLFCLQLPVHYVSIQINCYTN